MENKNIQNLIFSFFNMQGIKYKETEEDVWTAEIPEKFQSAFNSGETLRITFNREKAELHRDIELICEGSFLLRKVIEKLGEMPKVSRLFAGKQQPEVPENSSVKSLATKMHYRTTVAFNFKVSIEVDQKDEMLFSVTENLCDSSLIVKDGLFSVNPEEYSETPDPRIKLEEPGPEILRVYLQACQKIEEAIQPNIDEHRKKGIEKCREDMKVFDAYLNEQKLELLQKKENVSFHLYFFQKEEEIDIIAPKIKEAIKA